MIRKIGSGLTYSIRILWILLLCMGVTSCAFLYIMSNAGHIQRASINLNDGKPIVEEGDCILTPGMRVKKEFFVENNGSCDVWYRFYFDEVSGALKDSIEVTIQDGETVLYQGVVSNLEKRICKPLPPMRSH